MIYGLVLCGGHGNRLSPLSSAELPKQFLKLFSARTLLEDTIDRILPNMDKVLVVSSENYRDIVTEIVDPYGDKIETIFEPFPRNTGSAITLATQNLDDSDYVVVCPSDHYIDDVHELLQTLDLIFWYNLIEKLTCISVKPQSNSSELGYVTLGSFIEKPTKKIASELIEHGYQWNTGIYIFQMSLFRELMKKYAPIVLKLATYESYNLCPTISFDNMLSVRTKEIMNVQSFFDWNDIGTFASLYEVISKLSVYRKSVSRYWGNYEVLRKSNNYKMKLLTIEKDKSISLQYHARRREIWYIVSGEGSFINQNHIPINKESNRIYTSGMVIDVPIRNIHKITASEETKVFEIQIGDYLEEDDIIRLGETYGKISKD